MSDFDDHPLVKRYNRDTYYDEEAYKKLISAKVELMTTFPFWGVIACDLVLVEEIGFKTPIGDINLVPTLGTDGRHIIYNAKFVNSLRIGEVTFAVAHEIRHCLDAHVGKNNRLGDRDPKLFNKAGDYCINQELKDADIGEFITTIKILYDKKFDKMYTEEVYDIIEKDPKYQNGNPFDVHIGVSSKQPGSDKGEVIHKTDDVTIIKNSDGSITVVKSGDVIDTENSEMGDLIKRAVNAQYEAEKKGYIKNNGASAIPGDVLRYFEKLSQPKIDWRTALKRFIFTVSSTGYSFSSPNKALFNSGFTLPGFRRRDKCLELALAFDTSGSVSKKFSETFLSEFMGILSIVPKFKIHVWCFDGHVHEVSHHILTKTSNKNIATIVKPFFENYVGGGGTVFESNWQFMKAKNIHPKAFLVLSDGYPCQGYGDSKYCPTLFLFGVNEGADEENFPKKADFGKTIYVEVSAD